MMMMTYLIYRNKNFKNKNSLRTLIEIGILKKFIIYNLLFNKINLQLNKSQRKYHNVEFHTN